ncbi:MAG: tetratricopeptide repeat protein, partial [Planctomycetes bacterium]|nr:tetratricopeptide repeat protein [Planctomycetota bacterium]
AEAEFNLANTFRDQGRLTDAEMHYRRAVQTVPDFAEVWNNLGVLLQGGRRLAEAEDCLHRAVRCRPDYAEAYNNLGNVLRERQDSESAVDAYRRCLQIRPDFADARVNLGGVLTEWGRWDDAESVLREAVRLVPDHFRAHNNLGMVLFDQNRAEEAIDCYDTALRIAPEFAEARCNRALAELYLGNGARGWRDYEARWELPQHQRPCFRQPVWDGSDLSGRTILLDWEQGLGDTIQFVRFANVVQQHGGRVVLRCQKPLAALLRQTPGIERIVPDGEELPAFDLHTSLLSLPGILNLEFTALPDCVPYIFADRRLHEHWQQRLQNVNGYRIGIFWQGNPDFQRDEFRSIPLKQFLPLAQIPGVRLISLQKGAGCEQIREFGSRLPLVDFGDELDEAHGAFMDTAGILRNLDLVITADSAVAHLAGAMGVPVCVALCRLPEWRWIRGRRSSPWYPTMRLYRQETLGDWASVFREIADDLHGLLESGNTTGEPGTSVTADIELADTPDSPEHLRPIVVRGIQP